jgi:hypothetical protein
MKRRDNFSIHSLFCVRPNITWSREIVSLSVSLWCALRPPSSALVYPRCPAYSSSSLIHLFEMWRTTSGRKYHIFFVSQYPHKNPKTGFHVRYAAIFIECQLDPNNPGVMMDLTWPSRFMFHFHFAICLLVRFEFALNPL